MRTWMKGLLGGILSGLGTLILFVGASHSVMGPGQRPSSSWPGPFWSGASGLWNGAPWASGATPSNPRDRRLTARFRLNIDDPLPIRQRVFCVSVFTPSARIIA